MSDKRYKFTDVFQKVAVPDEIGALTIKNAFLERESNVLYLNLLEYLSEERKSEISSLLTSQFAFNGVVVDCAESEPETEPDPAAEPQPTPEHVDDTVAETKADAAAEIPEVQTAAEENTDIFTFADVLNRVTSKSPPAASLLAGCKYTVSGSTITITLTKGGKSYLDARGVTAYLEKQMRAACDKPYTIVYDGTIVVDNTDNDEEILALSTELSTEANVKRERVLLGDKITKATVQMASISEDTGKVCVEGDIFKIDTRETRDGSKLRATIFITDYTASVALKLEDYTDKLGRVME